MSESRFKLKFITDDDVKRETLQLVADIKEETKSEFEFDGEPFYCIGRGHSFGYGFYLEYITKTGIRAKQFNSGLWFIGSEEYTYDKKWILIPKPEYTPIDFSKLTFPVVKNVKDTTLAQQLTSVKPITGDEK